MPRQDNASRWTADSEPPAAAVFHVEHVVDPFTLQTAVGMVRHPGRAFEAELPGPRVDSDDRHWQAVGFRYLQALGRALRLEPGSSGWLHRDVWAALSLPRRERLRGFGWLDETWNGPVTGSKLPQGKGPLGSFRVDRTDADEKPLLPFTKVLLAGNVDQEHRLHLGSDVGLRIAIHVHRDRARIYGATFSGLSGDRAIRAVPEAGLFTSADYDMGDLKRTIGEALGCGGYVWIASIERPCDPGASGSRLDASGFALKWRRQGDPAAASASSETPGTGKDKPSRTWVQDFRVDVEKGGDGKFRVVRIHRNAFVGSAIHAERWRTGRAFLADPASQGDASTLSKRRPTRSDEELDAFCSDVQLNLDQDNTLRFATSGPLFEARGTSAQGAGTVALETGNVVQLRSDLRSAPLMSDAHASLEAHVRAADLFSRFQGYGIDAHAYFRFARLPLVQRARPAMQWAPDGELANAEVRPFIGDPAADRASPRAGDRMQLLVKYGSASPMHREKLPLVDTPVPGGPAGASHRRRDRLQRKRAQYLSVASDPRWAWHEFGHVLNFASTGELEFPFAHSAGDALGAIAADPLSRLFSADDPEAPIRFVSFPWIEVPGRSHGRAARAGYCWCGRRNLVRLDFKAPLERYRHSYFGEQLMSSSLFRLYRSLGGDTRGAATGAAGEDDADALVRLEASDYCIYLVMHAVSLLGPDSVAPARTADQFVSALIDADLGTGAWRVAADWPFDRDPRVMTRHGGRVHKVIRWAFERQGLYATGDPRAAVEGPGLPPPVDLFIADRRPCVGPDGESGGYAPVALRTSREEAWHANADAVKRNGRRLEVELNNRGTNAAEAVSVRVWWGSLDPQGTAIGWQGGETTTLGGRVVASEPRSISVDLPAKLPADAWFLVSADTPADPSNLEAGERPPSDLRSLMELVAHDNNLALAPSQPGRSRSV